MSALTKTAAYLNQHNPKQNMEELMAKIKSALNDKPVSEIIRISKDRNGKLTDVNAKVKVDSNLLTRHSAAISALEAKENGVGTAKDSLKLSVEERDAAKSELESIDISIVNSINSQSQDPSALLTTGYPLVEEKSAAAAIEQVVNLSSATGDEPGEIDVNFDRVKSATGYEFQISIDNPENWTNAGAAGKTSKHTFNNLTPGKKYWIRVRAFRGEDKGAWSNPVTTTAPY